MKRPAIFFDRDNTLIHCDGFLGDPSAVQLVSGAAQAVARARSMGFAVVVVSNESGVARGLFTERDVDAVNHRMDQMLQEQDHSAVVDRHEYCPFHPDGSIEQYRHESELRVPHAGMIHRAARLLGLDLGTSWVVGDSPADAEAGAAAGCRTILVADPVLVPASTASSMGGADPDETVCSLAEAMDVIEAAGGSSTPDDSIAQLNQLDQGRGRLFSQPVESDMSEQRLAQVPEPGRSMVVSSPFKGLSNPLPDLGRMESLTQQLLQQVNALCELASPPPRRFSLSKMIAGITQVMALGAAVGGYVYWVQAMPLLLVAIFLQALTATLLLMGRQK